jgi:hypothetical protein
MPSILVFLLFFATTPVLCMPAIIALFTRHRRTGWIVALNAVLWTLGFLTAHAIATEAHDGPGIGPGVAVLLWIALLAWTLRSADRARRRPAS